MKKIKIMIPILVLVGLMTIFLSSCNAKTEIKQTDYIEKLTFPDELDTFDRTTVKMGYITFSYPQQVATLTDLSNEISLEQSSPKELKQMYQIKYSDGSTMLVKEYANGSLLSYDYAESLIDDYMKDKPLTTYLYANNDNKYKNPFWSTVVYGMKIETFTATYQDRDKNVITYHNHSCFSNGNLYVFETEYPQVYNDYSTTAVYDLMVMRVGLQENIDN